MQLFSVALCHRLPARLLHTTEQLIRICKDMPTSNKNEIIGRLHFFYSLIQIMAMCGFCGWW